MSDTTNAQVDALLAMVGRLQPEEFIERRMGEFRDIYSRLRWNGFMYQPVEAVCTGGEAGELLVTIELMAISGRLREVQADLLWMAGGRR